MTDQTKREQQEACIAWLQAKWRRHGELEDKYSYEAIQDLIAEIEGAYESHGKIMADWNEAELSLRNKLKAEQQQRNILRDTLDEDRAEKYALELKLDAEQARRVEAERRLNEIAQLSNGLTPSNDERQLLYDIYAVTQGHTKWTEPTEEGTEQ